jgi:hypothetical protein
MSKGLLDVAICFYRVDIVNQFMKLQCITKAYSPMAPKSRVTSFITNISLPPKPQHLLVW